MDRSRMTARVVPLNSDDAGDGRMGGTPDERVAAIAALTAEAWRLAGLPLPDYSRATMSIVLATLRDHASTT